MSTEFFRKYIDIVNEAGVDEAVRGMVYDPVDGTSSRPINPNQRDTVAKGLKAARRYNQDAAKYATNQAPNEIPQAPEEAPLAPNEKIRGARSGMIRVPNMDADDAAATRLAGMSPLSLGGDSTAGRGRETTAIDTSQISADTRAKIRGPIRAGQGKANEPQPPKRPW